MLIEIFCPSCQTMLDMPELIRGKGLRCGTCGAEFAPSEGEPEMVIEVVEEGGPCREHDTSRISSDRRPVLPARLAPPVSGATANSSTAESKTEGGNGRAYIVGALATLLLVVVLAAVGLWVWWINSPSGPDGKSQADLFTVPKIAAPDTPLLRYRFNGIGSHTYAVEIEADAGDAVKVLHGNCTYTVQPNAALAPKPRDVDRKGEGTAFVINSGGYLVTCAHVVEGAKSVTVMVQGKTHNARVVTSDSTRDFALIKIDATGLPTVPLGDSDMIEVGQEARAIGFPMGSDLGTNVKANRGTVSGIDDRERGLKTIQLDVNVNPGNSGGPLVNEAGEVIGMVFYRTFRGPTSSVGFAVPINYVKKALDEQRVAYATELLPAKLEGAALVRKVAPAVAFVTSVGAGGIVSKDSLTLKVAGHLTQSSRPKPGGGRVGVPLNPFQGVGNALHDECDVQITPYGKIINMSGTGQAIYPLGRLSLLALDELSPLQLPTWNVDEARVFEERIMENNAAAPGGFPGMPTRPFGPRGFGGIPNIPGFGGFGDARDRLPGIPEFGGFGGGRDRFPGIPGFGGGGGARDNERRERTQSYAAIERTIYTMGEVNGDTVQVGKSVELKTLDKEPRRPRVHMTGDGVITFDVKMGLPRSLQFRATLIENTPNGSAELPITVSYRLLDGPVAPK